MLNLRRKNITRVIFLGMLLKRLVMVWILSCNHADKTLPRMPGILPAFFFRNFDFLRLFTNRLLVIVIASLWPNYPLENNNIY